MAESCCQSCVKFVLFAFNFVFWLIGCVLVGVGIFVRVDGTISTLQSGCNSSYIHLHTAAYILIGVGAAVMILGFLGCCGAMRESQCLLVLFALALFFLFGVLVAAGVWAIIDKQRVNIAVDEHLTNAVNKYDTDVSCKTLMDHIQAQLTCCGATKGYSDYTALPIPLLVPASCKATSYSEPCAKTIKTIMARWLVVVAGICIGVGIVMLFGMILSLVLCCGVRRTRRLVNTRYRY